MNYLDLTEAYIIPPSKGGDKSPSNLMELTTFEAMMKGTLTWDEWLVDRKTWLNYFEVPVVKEKLPQMKRARYSKFLHNIVWDVDLRFLCKFRNFNKLTVLVKRINKTMRKDMTTEHFVAYMDHFYFDEKFNNIYNYFIFMGSDKRWSVSLDHILPLSKGGSQIDINNIEFMTWTENNVKRNTLKDEWQAVLEDAKTNPQLYFKDT